MPFIYNYIKYVDNCDNNASTKPFTTCNMVLQLKFSDFISANVFFTPLFKKIKILIEKAVKLQHQLPKQLDR